MATPTTIIGKETLPDGRVLEYGARDPATGQRFERIVMGAVPVAPVKPTIPGVQVLGGDAMAETIKKIQENIAGITERVKTEGITSPASATCITGQTREDAISGKQQTCENGVWKDTLNAYGNVPGSGATGGTPKQPKVPLDANQALKDKVSALELTAFSKPTTTWEETYQKAFNQAGLADLKTQIDTLNADIKQKRDDFVKASGEITENPWLSESGRIGRIKTLQNMAEASINNLISQRDAVYETYKLGLGQAEKVADKMTAEVEAGRKLTAEELAYYQKQLEAAGKPAEIPKTFTTDEGTFVWELSDDGTKWEAKLISPAKDKEELLSPAEAKSLGVPYGTTKSQAAEMGITPKVELTQIEKDQTTYQTIVSQLEASKGADGFVNTAKYALLKTQYPDIFKKWITPEEWLNPKDPTAKVYLAKPATTLADIQVQTTDIFQQYKDAGYSKKQIENQWKSENNTTTLSPIVKSILDTMFQ